MSVSPREMPGHRSARWPEGFGSAGAHFRSNEHGCGPAVRVDGTEPREVDLEPALRAQLRARIGIPVRVVENDHAVAPHHAACRRDARLPEAAVDNDDVELASRAFRTHRVAVAIGFLDQAQVAEAEVPNDARPLRIVLYGHQFPDQARPEDRRVAAAELENPLVAQIERSQELDRGIGVPRDRRPFRVDRALFHESALPAEIERQYPPRLASL